MDDGAGLSDEDAFFEGFKRNRIVFKNDRAADQQKDADTVCKGIPRGIAVFFQPVTVNPASLDFLIRQAYILDRAAVSGWHSSPFDDRHVLARIGI